jgi:hypothetical protein
MPAFWRACPAILILAIALPARAQPAQQPREPDDDDLALRLDWMARVLDREAAATKLWRESWLTFFGAAVLFESHLAATATSPEARVHAGVTMGEASLAFGFIVVSPASAEATARTFHASTGESRAERLARLHRAEAMLAELAAEERTRRGWFGLSGAALVTSAGAVIDWSANRSGAGLGWLGLTTGLLVSQIQFHTQPTGAIRAWDAYRRAGAGARLGPPPPVLRWSIGPTAGGVGMRGAF